MQKGIDVIGSSISISAADTKTKEELIKENEELRLIIEELNDKLDKNKVKQKELESLQNLYKLDQTYYDYETTGARIIAKGTSNWFNTFTIDKGSNDGIKPDMNVIADGGLIGIVVDVGVNYSVVRSIIDDTSNVSATISSTEDNCIVSGSLLTMSEENMILFADLDDDNSVAIGDAVVTSNISDKYMPGLLIGYISYIQNDPNDLTKSGKITTVADFKHLSDVLVIMEVKEIE
ncbi:MAG: rod shape-determining protein MreC [Pseudobutyrivibrio sp.]|nr:rod shape-determining protein MreC [Pseudobutyrivibrio sp.]